MTKEQKTWLKKIEKEPRAFENMPKELITEALCREAVTRAHWAALEYVPDALKTESLCFAAVRTFGLALEFVPDALKTEALCLKAVRSCGWSLMFVPDALKTEAVCLAAVQEHGAALGCVPESKRTETLCLAAVQQSKFAMEDVPSNFQAKIKNVIDDIPRIGIFWLCIKDGEIKIFHSEPITLEFGQDYGCFIVAPREHYNTWESLKPHGIIPKNSNYEDLPRGRVAYDKDKDQYVVYHGNYIKSSPDIKPAVKANFKLKNNTRWETDLHYNKFKRWGF